MKIKLIIISLFTPFIISGQDSGSAPNLGDFSLSNNSTPAFLLVEETPTSIYVPDNLRALAIHAFDNFGRSMSVEFTPYFFIGKPDRSYYNYVGLKTEDNSDFRADMSHTEIKQDIFSGALKTLSISGAYVDKEFENIGTARKTYSIGARSTLIRIYSNSSKEKIVNNATTVANLLAGFSPSQATSMKLENATTDAELAEAKRLYNEEKKAWDEVYGDKFAKAKTEFRKTIKPSIRLDGALGYSALFKENKIDAGTANRFGSWLTGEASILLNAGKENDTNNYFNLFFTARYIEDGFNLNDQNMYTTYYYRDMGGKIEFEFGKFAFSYEYISRNGNVDSERSVGNLKYIINKDISIIGGFGKDFQLEDNLFTIFGVNFGLNLGNNSAKVQQ